MGVLQGSRAVMPSMKVTQTKTTEINTKLEVQINSNVNCCFHFDLKRMEETTSLPDGNSGLDRG